MADALTQDAGPRSADPLLSVVVPVFNEEDLVGELVERIVSGCHRLDHRFEVLIVNDGSRDGTLPRLLAESRELSMVRVIDLQRNFGHMAALSAGLASARGDAAIVMDGDLQDPPELIPEFVAAWLKGADVVYGARTGRHEGRPRQLLAGLFYRLLARLSSTPIPESAGTYGLIDRRVLDQLNSLPERSRFFAGLRAWAGGKQVAIPYDRPARSKGRSRVGLGGQFTLAFGAFTSFSKAPLRLASGLSLAVGLGLFLAGMAAFIIRIFTNSATPGWATFTILIGIMGLAQSIVLATMAEYLGVIFDEVKGRPIFLIREEYVGGRAVSLGPELPRPALNIQDRR